MDSAPSIETVLVALNGLYRNPDTTGKEKASVWLGELQKSVSYAARARWLHIFELARYWKLGHYRSTTSAEIR